MDFWRPLLSPSKSLACKFIAAPKVMSLFSKGLVEGASLVTSDGAFVRLRSRATAAGVQLSVLFPKRCRKPGPLGLVVSPTPLPAVLWWSGWQTLSAPPGMPPMPFSASHHFSNPCPMRARVPRGSQSARLLGGSSTGGLPGSQMSHTPVAATSPAGAPAPPVLSPQPSAGLIKAQSCKPNPIHSTEP